MNTAYQKKWPLYLSTKNTILKKYDGRYAFFLLSLIQCILFFHMSELVVMLPHLSFWTPKFYYVYNLMLIFSSW